MQRVTTYWSAFYKQWFTSARDFSHAVSLKKRKKEHEPAYWNTISYMAPLLPFSFAPATTLWARHFRERERETESLLLLLALLYLHITDLTSSPRESSAWSFCTHLPSRLAVFTYGRYKTLVIKLRAKIAIFNLPNIDAILFWLELYGEWKYSLIDTLRRDVRIVIYAVWTKDVDMLILTCIIICTHINSAENEIDCWGVRLVWF